MQSGCFARALSCRRARQFLDRLGKVQMRSKAWKIRLKFFHLMSQEEGQDLVEYALLIALISVAAITSLHTLANKIVGTFNAIGSGL